MESGETQTVASFTGTLLKREHQIGQKLVQLVFREDDKNVLCISTDPKDASWQVGQVYSVKGALCERAGRTFIQNPKIAQFKKHWSLVKKFVVGGIALSTVCAGGTVFAMEGHSNPTTVVHTPVTTIQNTADVQPRTTPQSSTVTAPTAPATPIATTPRTTPVKKSTTVTTNTTPGSAIPTVPASVPVPAPTPTPATDSTTTAPPTNADTSGSSATSTTASGTNQSNTTGTTPTVPADPTSTTPGPQPSTPV